MARFVEAALSAKAAKHVLAYAIGRPEATVDPDRLDIEEWQNFKEGAGMMSALPELLQKPDPELPLAMLRAARPGVTSELGRLVNQTLGGAKPAPAAEPSPSPARFNGHGAEPKAAPPEVGKKAAAGSAATSGSEPQQAIQKRSPSPARVNGYGPTPKAASPEFGQKALADSVTTSGREQQPIHRRSPSPDRVNGHLRNNKKADKGYRL